MIGWGVVNVTVFCCKALARCCAPWLIEVASGGSAGIDLLPKELNTRRWVRSDSFSQDISFQRFVGGCRSWTPILLERRRSVVSVCVKQWRKLRWKIENVTLFCCKASARCCTPWSPIPFRARSSMVSVCMTQWMNYRMKMWVWGCYVVLLQSICKMLYSLVTNSILGEVKSGECLYDAVNEL